MAIELGDSVKVVLHRDLARIVEQAVHERGTQHPEQRHLDQTLRKR